MKPHPQYHSNPHTGYQNMSENQSHSMKQSGSGSRYSHSTEVVVNSKVIPTKLYAKSLSDQLHSETVSEPLSGKPPEHNMDPGVRECPSGASSPGGTPNITLGISSKVSHHSDPLAASGSESKLIQPSGGQNRVLLQPPHDGMETQSDTNLLNYPQHPGVGVAGGVVLGRGQVKVAQKPHKSGSVKGTIKSWENRGVKSEGDHGDTMPPTRVLHLPISSAVKERGRGGEQGMAAPNGYAAAGGKGEAR